MTLPKLSIAAKLYGIFALMAGITLALAIGAVLNARHHAALTDEFESANAGTWNVERVNGLIYAVVMESRGVYMSPDLKTSKVYADGILKFNAEIAKVVDGLEEVGARRPRPRRSSSFPSASPSSSISAASWPASAPKSVRRRAASGVTTTPTARCARRSTRTWSGWPVFMPTAPATSMRASIPASTRRRCG